MLRVRLSAGSTVPGDVALGGGFDEVVTARKVEADAYYAALTPAPTTDDEALVLRQALAGMLWGKQFLHYDVARWLDGDPAGPPPPASLWVPRTLVTSCDLHVLVDEAAEPVSSEHADGRPGAWRGVACGRALIQ